MINRVGKICVAAMSLCMIVLIVTRKRGDGRYYFALSLGKHRLYVKGTPDSYEERI
jgi:hypothetical protein